jgi:hypothetical protein
MRRDFLASLADIGFIPFRADAADPALNANSDNENLLKAIITGALWPHVARVALPQGAIKYDRVSGGAVRRENVAKDFKLYELQGGQVFLHPGSILFSEADWRSPFVAYFIKHKTSKVFLRDATEVSTYTKFIITTLTCMLSDSDVRIATLWRSCHRQSCCWRSHDQHRRRTHPLACLAEDWYTGQPITKALGCAASSFIRGGDYAQRVG